MLDGSRDELGRNSDKAGLSLRRRKDAAMPELIGSSDNLWGVLEKGHGGPGSCFRLRDRGTRRHRALWRPHAQAGRWSRAMVKSQAEFEALLNLRAPPPLTQQEWTMLFEISYCSTEY